jgi:hypothetical protein
MRKKQQSSQVRIIIGCVCGALLVLCLWLGWQFLSLRGVAPRLLVPPLPDPTPTATPEVQPLLAQGIRLREPRQEPGLSQQQALLIANIRVAEMVSNAKVVSARHVLLVYTPGKTTSPGKAFDNMAAWMIWYQQVPLPPGDREVDPAPPARTEHDLYFFLDANTGKELFTVWG